MQSNGCARGAGPVSGALLVFAASSLVERTAPSTPPLTGESSSIAHRLQAQIGAARGNVRWRAHRDGRTRIIRVTTDLEVPLNTATMFDAQSTAAHEQPGTAPDAAAAVAPRRAPRFNWIPVRSLAPRHRPKILAHLIALEAADRYLRFGYAAADQQLAAYVDSLDFERDEVFGVFNRRLQLVAMAHLAYMSVVMGQTRQAEFGVSVLPAARGRGHGSRLFDHATLHARNRGVSSLVIHALSENTAMLKIISKAGAHIERNGPESEAVLMLPPENLGSHVEAFVEAQAAEFDYGMKVQRHRLDHLVGTLTTDTASAAQHEGNG